MHGFTLCRNVTLFIIGSLLCIKKIFLPSSLLLSHQLYWWDLNPKMIILIFLTVITDIGKFKINWTYDLRKKEFHNFLSFGVMTHYLDQKLYIWFTLLSIMGALCQFMASCKGKWWIDTAILTALWNTSAWPDRKWTTLNIRCPFFCFFWLLPHPIDLQVLFWPTAGVRQTCEGPHFALN